MDNLNELCDLITDSIHIQSTPEQCAAGIKQFGKMLDDFKKLTDYEKAQFWINAFRNPDNKDICEAFAMRHPDCSLNGFIPR